MKTRLFTLVGAAGVLLAVPAFAQMGTTTPAPPPAKKPGILSRILHRGQPAPAPGTYAPNTGTYSPNGGAMPMGRRPMMGGVMPMTGGVVGNKNTHVYHLPGDRSQLPSPQNRVYFRSAAAAEAAGYHRAGSGSMGMRGHSPAMHPGMTRHMGTYPTVVH